MSKAQFLLGRPVQFTPDISIYPPLIKDIVDQEYFWGYVKVLTLTQEEIQDELVKAGDVKEFPSPFIYLLSLCKYQKDYTDFVTNALKFFIHKDITILYDVGRILCGDAKKVIEESRALDDSLYLTEQNYFDFQNLIRQACGMAIVEKPNLNEDPRIARMKAKARLRDKVKQKQAAKNGISFEKSLVLICCMNVGVTPLNIGEISYAMFGELFGTYQVKDQYELDIKALLAGADSKKIHPVHWIK